MAELLSTGRAPRARLRELLSAGAGPLVAPGAYDALSARLIEQAGFDVGLHDRLRHDGLADRPPRRRAARAARRWSTTPAGSSPPSTCR